MAIKMTDDLQTRAAVLRAIADNDGYCPCSIACTEDTKCMCKEFRDQIKDPNFEGYCHCLLYFKSK